MQAAPMLLLRLRLRRGHIGCAEQLKYTRSCSRQRRVMIGASGSWSRRAPSWCKNKNGNTALIPGLPERSQSVCPRPSCGGSPESEPIRVHSAHDGSRQWSPTVRPDPDRGGPEVESESSKGFTRGFTALMIMTVTICASRSCSRQGLTQIRQAIKAKRRSCLRPRMVTTCAPGSCSMQEQT